MTDTLKYAPKNYEWPRCPEAAEFITRHMDAFLAHHEFAHTLARRMLDQTSTCFFDWLDHLVLPAGELDADELARCGFVPDDAEAPPGITPYWHPHAQLPRLLVAPDARATGLAIHVDCLRDFQLAHGLGLPMEGAPFTRYRILRVPEGERIFTVVERRGYRSYLPGDAPGADDYIQALDVWCARPRQSNDDAEGMQATRALARKLAADLGPDMAACVFLDGERRYWQARNTAGRFQKWRQDHLGLGWANHDHHTFRSSRVHFPALIEILTTFGFERRERFYAGGEAGWGAQVMEQPQSGLVIFADMDLRPEDTKVDFSQVPLPDLDQPGTVGLWCALHGESILQAGPHHLEAQFDFDHLTEALAAGGHAMMNPFSDFSYLRQAFTLGEMWPVAPSRLDRLLAGGKISTEAAERIRTEGAVGSHMENLQRHEGFKGFNQQAVSAIIAEVNPEQQALHGT